MIQRIIDWIPGEVFVLAEGLMIAEWGNGKSNYLEGKPYDFCDAEPQEDPVTSEFREKEKNSATVERWLKDSSTKYEQVYSIHRQL